jgi:hypothetical protein
MNRRQLLGLLVAAPVALIVPELIVPERKIFLPPVGGWDLAAGSDITVMTMFNVVGATGSVIRLFEGKTQHVSEFVCIGEGKWVRLRGDIQPSSPAGQLWTHPGDLISSLNVQFEEI